MATAAILKFLSLNIMCTHVRQNFWKVSSNFEHHSKPTMNINSQHHNLLGNQISYLGYHGNGRYFEFVQPPKAATTTVDIPTKWIIIWLLNHGYQFPTSKSTWKPNFAQIGGILYFGGLFGFKMAATANQRWISIRNIIIYLETKFRPNRRIFLFGGHFVRWLPWQRPPFWIFFQPPKKLSHTTVDIPTKFH